MNITEPFEGRVIAAEGALYYPNRMGRIVLTAMEDIMGRHAVNATLNYAGLGYLVDNYPPNDLELGFTFVELSTIQEKLDDIFGKHGGRALAVGQLGKSNGLHFRILRVNTPQGVRSIDVHARNKALPPAPF